MYICFAHVFMYIYIFHIHVLLLLYASVFHMYTYSYIHIYVACFLSFSTLQLYSAMWSYSRTVRVPQAEVTEKWLGDFTVTLQPTGSQLFLHLENYGTHHQEKVTPCEAVTSPPSQSTWKTYKNRIKLGEEKGWEREIQHEQFEK